MKRNIKLKALRITLFLVNVIVVLPILILAFYNVPSADDFSMAYEVHESYVSGGFFSAIIKAIYMGIWYYFNWTGVYFSNTLTALAPSVFGEHFYFIGTWVVLFMFALGLWYFFKQLLCETLRVEKHLAGCITNIMFFLLVQCMPVGASRVEGFFWYSGAINYLFMFGFALLWLGMILHLASLESVKGYLVPILSVMGFLLGGANYMTSLSLAIISVCILIISIIASVSGKAPLEKQIELRKHEIFKIAERFDGLKRAYIPAICMLVGFALSAIAPGNKVRSDSAAFNPIKAILMAVYYTMDAMLGKWLTWPTIILLVFLIPFLWKATGRIKRFYGFEHPALFTAFCFLLSAASITPPIYATGSIEAGRIQALFYMQGMILLSLIIGYMCGWIRYVIKPAKLIDGDVLAKRKPKDFLEDAYLGQHATRVVFAVSAAFIAGSLLAVKPEPDLYTGTAALEDIFSGDAYYYMKEFDERLKVLKDDNVKEAEFGAFSVHPQLLFFSDITKDEGDWLNKAMAEYYHKDKVVLQND
ncbi:DUF6056 family protein [Butyrivibrio sp. XPD2002]|uniref:DUF6056 family protein n=1 Tax=Butyrivibrio sp. XPD2002 TaxID=1280665 RepID=UPI00041AF492|nr:DUF6056 family protein [Butyrivibrio sp. XPD2002]